MALDKTLKWLSICLHKDARQFYITVKWPCKELNFVVGSLVQKFIMYSVIIY